MAPEGYELIKYQIHGIDTWVIKDQNGIVWFPLSEIFKNLFKVSFTVTRIREQQAKHTIRIRMVTPRKALKQLSIEEQPKDVIILGDLWCIRNLIRTRFRLNADQANKGRDILIEEFAQHWGFSAIGYGVLTTREPNWRNYTLMEQIAIAAESNKKYWLRCIECEKYFPHTSHFYGSTNSTCEKCLGREFQIKSDGAYGRIEELLKKKGRI